MVTRRTLRQTSQSRGKKPDTLVEAGTYIVAVSGGVDSMVLLDMLSSRSDLRLIVAHFDHGMRGDSDQDKVLVEEVSRRYSLPFVSTKGGLGARTSEATARRARYEFLEQVRQHRRARAIITAHHQDDVLETAILNILRGTGRKGLTSLANTPKLIRPLLGVPKQDIITYARNRRLRWREDYTNADEHYLRNYVRNRLLPRFAPEARLKMLDIIEQTRVVNEKLDADLVRLLRHQSGKGRLNRSLFVRLDYAVAKEILASWLRLNDIRNFDSKTLDRVVVKGKVACGGSLINVTGNTSVEVRGNELALVTRER